MKTIFTIILLMLGVSSYGQYFINANAETLKAHAIKYDMRLIEHNVDTGEYYVEIYDKEVNIICYFNEDRSEIYFTYVIPQVTYIFTDLKQSLDKNWIKMTGKTWDTYYEWGAVHAEMRIGDKDDFTYPYFSFVRDIY